LAEFRPRFVLSGTQVARQRAFVAKISAKGLKYKGQLRLI